MKVFIKIILTCGLLSSGMASCPLQEADSNSRGRIWYFVCLDLESLKNCGLVCKSLNQGMKKAFRFKEIKVKAASINLFTINELKCFGAIELVKNPQTTNADLILIGQLGRLNTLDLSETPITDQGLRLIKNLTHLKRLNLSETKITDQGILWLLKMTRLKTLNLQGTSVSDSGLLKYFVHHFPNMQELSLQMSEVTANGVHAFFDQLERTDMHIFF